MEQESEIRCPKCNSNQLTANKKGFSGKKAIVGGLLTGGVGLLAGTIGSNKVKITCLACGNEFKPGEGKIVSAEPVKAKEPDLNEIRLQELIERKERENREKEKLEPKITIDPLDAELFKILQEGFVRGAIYHYRKKKKVSKEEASAYVEKLIADNNLTNKVRRKGCFVATACYGDYDAPEVVILRQFRDAKLLNSFFGKIFVQFYYIVSPILVILISKSHLLKKIVRYYLLEPIVSKLRQQNGR